MFGWEATEIAKYQADEKKKKAKERMGTHTKKYWENIDKQKEFLGH
jgi:hypothetical protein